MDKIAVTFSQRAHLFSHRLALSPFFSMLEDLLWDRGSGIQRILESISRAVVASQVAIWLASSPSPSSVGWNLLWVPSSTSSISAASGDNWLALCASSGSGGNWFVKPWAATITTLSLMKSTREWISPSGSPQGWYGSSVSSCFRPWHLWTSSCPFAWFEVARFPRQTNCHLEEALWWSHSSAEVKDLVASSLLPPNPSLRQSCTTTRVPPSRWQLVSVTENMPPRVPAFRYQTIPPRAHQVTFSVILRRSPWGEQQITRKEGLSSKKPPHHSKPLSPSASGHNSFAIEETLSSTFELADRVSTGSILMILMMHHDTCHFLLVLQLHLWSVSTCQHATPSELNANHPATHISHQGMFLEPSKQLQCYSHRATICGPDRSRQRHCKEMLASSAKWTKWTVSKMNLPLCPITSSSCISL